MSDADSMRTDLIVSTRQDYSERPVSVCALAHIWEDATLALIPRNVSPI